MIERPLRILYAVQGTGNGHVARAREILPLLEQHGQVDVLVSGDQSEVDLGFPVRLRSRGLTFIYDRSGAISLRKTLFKNNLIRIAREIAGFDFSDYDLIINDFEFITAWAGRLRRKAVYGFGHQASFLSPRCPRPSKRSLHGELILKYYAPCSSAYGLHFDRYDRFVYPPVIRSEVRSLHIQNQGHYTVYLPAFGADELLEALLSIEGVEWQIFNKFSQKETRVGSVWIRPIDNRTFLESFASCEGVLTGAGFETPAEALFLGKKLCCIPIRRQYEQYCNAAALEKLGIPIVDKLDSKGIEQIRHWVEHGAPARVEYPDLSAQIVEEIVRTHRESSDAR
jgi:uncharacterized protein (TIGR00661 family)